MKNPYANKNIFSRNKSNNNAAAAAKPKKHKKVGTEAEFFKQYDLTNTVLGSGSYAEVRKGLNKSTGRAVAIKIINKSGMSEKDLKKLHKEVDILRKLRHKNIVRFYDAFEEEKKLYIVMEYVTGGELFSKIVDDDNKYSENDVKRIVRTMAEALKFCKEQGVIHRDIKPENILLSDNEDGELMENGEPVQDIKIADFNLSYKLHPDEAEFTILQTMCGTPNYVAPEVLSGLPYDYKCDIWSLGVISYLLLSGGYLPFFVNEDGEEGRRRLLQKVKAGKWDFTPESAWAGVSDIAKDFVSNVMNRKPDERFSYEQLLAHPWLIEKKETRKEKTGNQGLIINGNELKQRENKINAIKKKMELYFIMAEFGKKAGEIMNSEDDVPDPLPKPVTQNSVDASALEAFGEFL